MSNFSGDRSELARVIFALPCHVKIPAECRDRFERNGLVPIDNHETRRYPRAFCPSSEQRAGLEYRQTFPTLAREHAWYGVCVADVSRSGCRFLHSEPLFPGERLGLVLLTGYRVEIEIRWCRRIDKQCFEVGARYGEVLEGNPLACRGAATG